MPKSLEARFTEKYKPNPETGCWEWSANCNDHGYGRFGVKGRMQAAHRVAYEIFVGPIPEGHQIDHTCHNQDAKCAGGKACRHRRCVNPAHLEAVTKRENLMRGQTFVAANAAKTHCPQEHPYDEENTYITRSGSRICKTCQRNYPRYVKKADR